MYSQLICLTFSDKKDSVKPLRCVVVRWQLDYKTAKVTSFPSGQDNKLNKAVMQHTDIIS